MEIDRKDFTDETADGGTVAIREVRRCAAPTRTPMVLLHGTSILGLIEFDLPVPGGSPR